MSLEGLRAWIGEVERKLGMRTRVFLALAVVAVGLGGAAIYLAIDARESSVSESDVQALQERLEAQTGGGEAVGTQVAQLESELRALQAEVAELKSGTGAAGQKKGASGGASPPTGAGATAQELLEQAKENSAESGEAGTTGK